MTFYHLPYVPIYVNLSNRSLLIAIHKLLLRFFAKSHTTQNQHQWKYIYQKWYNHLKNHNVIHTWNVATE